MKIYYDSVKDDIIDISRTFVFIESDDRYEVEDFTGQIEKSGDFYTVFGTLKYTVHSCCDRCLEHLDISEEVYVSHIISNKGLYSGQIDDTGLTDEEADIYITPREYIDIDEFLREEILLQIPVKKLCSTDCKGIEY